MNKKLIREKVSEDGSQKITTYSEEFNPQDIHMKYYDYNGDLAFPEDGEEIKVYSFQAKIPGINMLDVISVKFPEFNYRNDEVAKVIVEYNIIDEKK